MGSNSAPHGGGPPCLSRLLPFQSSREQTQCPGSSPLWVHVFLLFWSFLPSILFYPNILIFFGYLDFHPVGSVLFSSHILSLKAPEMLILKIKSYLSLTSSRLRWLYPLLTGSGGSVPVGFPASRGGAGFCFPMSFSSSLPLCLPFLSNLYQVPRPTIQKQTSQWHFRVPPQGRPGDTGPVHAEALNPCPPALHPRFL